MPDLDDSPPEEPDRRLVVADDAQEPRWVDGVHPTLLLVYSTISGVLLTLGLGLAATRTPGGGVMVVIGAGASLALWLLNANVGVAWLAGLVVGLDGGVLMLLLDPACSSIENLRIRSGPAGVDVICLRYDDNTGLAFSVAAGSLLIFGLMILLTKIRPARGAE